MQGMDVLAPQRRRNAANLLSRKLLGLFFFVKKHPTPLWDRGKEALGGRQAHVSFCSFLLYVHWYKALIWKSTSEGAFTYAAISCESEGGTQFYIL